MRTLFVGFAVVAALTASPVMADTVVCMDPAGTVRIEADIAFTPDRDGGNVRQVRVRTDTLSMSTAKAETLAFQRVPADRIELGLESPNVGPMTVYLDVVRIAEADGNGGPDTLVMAAGVARVASIGTTILECEGL